MTTAQAGRELHVSARTIAVYCRTGKLAATRKSPRGAWVISEMAVASFKRTYWGQTTMDRMELLIQAASLAGLPYALPPDGVNNTDCSLYVLTCYQAAGLPFSGVRTAEQIRQACNPIGWENVSPGDMVFFAHTYEPDEAPGPDGMVASHIGLSMGTGTRRMWDAHESETGGTSGVQLTDIGTAWWQEHIFEARRHPDQGPGISLTPNAVLGLSGVWDQVQRAGARYGVDPKVIAGVCDQESSFNNYVVHADGTGHGLFGLDDSGGLIEFEAWSGIACGRGSGAITIPPELQIEFVTRWFADKQAAYGSVEIAEAVWHRGPSLYTDSQGTEYIALIARRMQELFG